MKKKILIIGIILLVVLSVLLLIYPTIEFKNNGKLILFRYNDMITEFDDYTCYDDSYSYNEKRNISIHEIDINKYFIFYVITLEYTEGNICSTEYLLEETYIDNFIKNAKIKYNENNIDIAKLIEGKTAIIGNKRYLGNDYLRSIDYILDGVHNTLYVFYIDDLLVIQVGLSDEGPKFIAYK